MSDYLFFEKKIIKSSSDVILKNKLGAQKLSDWYGTEDSIFRLALYIDRREKGFSKVDAARDARKSFIDYFLNEIEDIEFENKNYLKIIEVFKNEFKKNRVIDINHFLDGKYKDIKEDVIDLSG